MVYLMRLDTANAAASTSPDTVEAGAFGSGLRICKSNSRRHRDRVYRRPVVTPVTAAVTIPCERRSLVVVVVVLVDLMPVNRNTTVGAAAK